MKAGILQFFSWPERRVPIEIVYERALQRIEVMDGAGYDAVWLAEHHFHTFSVCPSIHMMGVHVAARTKRLRIGTAVSLAALYHPLRLAEEVAFLDVLSGGRVNWGAGRGFDPTEFTAFGVPQAERSKRALYQRELEAAGHPTVGRQIPMARLLAIAPTRAAAELTARRGAQWLVDSYAGPQHGVLKSVVGFGVPAVETAARVDPIQRYLDGVIIYGTPDAVVDEIARLREELPLDYLLCAPLSHETFTLFTDRVLPRLASS